MQLPEWLDGKYKDNYIESDVRHSLANEEGECIDTDSVNCRVPVRSDWNALHDSHDLEGDPPSNDESAYES